MTTSTIRQAVALALAAVVSQAGAAGEHGRANLSFALLGDVPYGVSEEPKFDQVIAEINVARSVRLVVHTGDVKQGSERCDDAVLLKRFKQFQKFDDPFIVTPGDNDWTDCHRANNGSYLPTERLSHGDSHYFRMDKPLVLPVQPAGSAALENFTRLENFGSPSVHWVEVFVDARDPAVFSVVPHIVPQNVFAR